MTPDPTDDPVRGLVDELRGLLAGGAGRPGDAGGSGAAAGGAASQTDCKWCPLCQAAAVLRGERPEVTAALADVLSATATALRTLAAAGEAPRPGPRTPGDAARAGNPDDTGPADPPPAVQWIDIA